MLQTLAIAAVNPLLLWGMAGAAAPIIIHLLSKRKFKVVHWAAMDFLLDADQRNRRRVQIEDLIVLLLRCLACALIAMLVSRLFVEPAGLAAMAGQSARFERVFLLDDSPSMTVQDADAGNRSSFEEAKTGLAGMVRQLAAERPGDTLTLRVTSNPDAPILNGAPLTATRIDEYETIIDALAPTAHTAQLDTALATLERAINEDESGALNRVIYIVTDQRRRDWATTTPPPREPGRVGPDAPPPAPASTPRPSAAGAIVQRLADKVRSLVIIDAGAEARGNLTVTDLKPIEKTVVAGVDSRFDVTVRNDGPVDADDVEVTVIAGQTTLPPVRIDRIAAGESASAAFTFNFQDLGVAPMRATVPADVLPIDNERHASVAVRKGVRILIVDGAPSAEYGQSESFFLDRALNPPGEARSGNDVRIVTENQFEALPLDEFQVIFICNLYRITEDRQAALEAWVEAGGGLVLMLGDQVDAQVYNDRLYRGGAGLMPVQLAEVKGDKDERQWVNLRLDEADHPVVRIFSGTTNPFIDNVKVFQWWASNAAGDNRTRVVARWSDTDGSPAIVQRAFGDGRVLVMTTAFDADWSNWPVDPSYVVVTLETVRHMAAAATGAIGREVGTPIEHTIDPTKIQLNARLIPPTGEQEAVGLEAVTVFDDAANNDSGSDEGEATPPAPSARQVFAYDLTDQPGMYTLEMPARDGGTQIERFAVNVDPTEGRLARLTESQLRKQLGDAPVTFVKGFAAGDNDEGGRLELWRWILAALIGVLCVEQVLAWRFGQSR